MNHINEYYLTTHYENHFVEHDLFFNILDVLNRLHISYVRNMHSDFRKNGDDYDRITRIYLQTDFDTLFQIIKYFNDEKG